jgi:hypothetical protein
VLLTCFFNSYGTQMSILDTFHFLKTFSLHQCTLFFKKKGETYHTHLLIKGRRALTNRAKKL